MHMAKFCEASNSSCSLINFLQHSLLYVAHYVLVNLQLLDRNWWLI